MERILVPVNLNGEYIMHSNGEEESDDDVIIVHEEIADRRSENKNGTVKANQSSNGHSLTDSDVRLQGNLKSEEINM
uniref:Uncharacterized protein n=1 Tax=Trichobilharzia regenti TaxID=157069 RepID=A0AA85JE35_TRIRE|nr:unnamed protein product [Trichobilharzia regenti]